MMHIQPGISVHSRCSSNSSGESGTLNVMPGVSAGGSAAFRGPVERLPRCRG